jgi:asparagine synthase (glutamine-hydrolysing)
MCGFVGMVGLNGAAPDARAIERMAAAIQHRGPDDRGDFASGSVGFGFRRLSILDLSPAGHQPMISEDGQVVLVFNGEIYNYLELREELARLGHAFRSTGDSEVLLRAYLQWGHQCVGKFNGMWAFLIYDSRKGCVFGSRDRFGKKPLFRYRNGTHVLFASEIKSILASGLYRGGPNWALASRFLLQGTLDQLETDTQTFYADIEHVPAGSAFEMDLTGTVREWRFYTLPAAMEPEPAEPDRTYAEIFEDAVRLRLRSDVPVGLFLSGGLDSTSIACAVARLRRDTAADSVKPFYAFSCQSPGFDETAYIRDTVKRTGVELVPFHPDPLDLWSKIERLLWFQDEPVHSMVALITFELSRLAAERGVKVILNGGGADEYLAGYPNLFENYWYTVASEQGTGAAWREIKAYGVLHGAHPGGLFRRHLRRRLQAPLGRSASYRALSAWRRRRRLLSHPWFTRELVERLPREEQSFVEPTLEHALEQSMERAPLPFYLRMEDRNAMAHSIEARMPFLDYRLVSLAFQLPARWKMRGGLNKYLLRQAMRDRVPESVRSRPDKMGFPVPTEAWFAHELYEPTQDLLASQATRERGIYRVEAIRKDLESHRRGDTNVSRGAFNVIQFEMWSAIAKRHATVDRHDGQ